MQTIIPVQNYMVNLPNNFTGFNLAFVTTSTMTLSMGMCRDSTNTYDFITTEAMTIPLAKTGTNYGLDTGVRGNATWYYVYLIGSKLNTHPIATIYSASKVSPTLPYGYNYFRLIGMFLTDGSALITPFEQQGYTGYKYYNWINPVAVLTNGVATDWTAISVSPGVPAIANPHVYYSASFAANVAGDQFNVRPSGDGSVEGLIMNVDAKLTGKTTFRVSPKLISGVQKIDYKVATAGSLSLSVISFEFEV